MSDARYVYGTLEAAHSRIEDLEARVRELEAYIKKHVGATHCETSPEQQRIAELEAENAELRRERGRLAHALKNRDLYDLSNAEKRVNQLTARCFTTMWMQTP